MSVDLQSLHKILKHSIRRRIVLTLLEKKASTYIELMNIVEVENTGKLNYHLKVLGDLIEKDENGKYRLTEKGHLASQLLLRFPEKKSEHMPLRGGDAILLGFVGLLLTIINPGILIIFLAGSLGVAIIYLQTIIVLIYTVTVAGGIIWWLTVRRTNAHDFYDLFKPPLVTLVFFVLLLVTVRIMNVNLTFTIHLPDYTMIVFPIFPAFISLPFLTFIGVGVIEIIYRILKKTERI